MEEMSRRSSSSPQLFLWLWLERTATPNREANTRFHFTSQCTRGALQLSQA